MGQSQSLEVTIVARDEDLLARAAVYFSWTCITRQTTIAKKMMNVMSLLVKQRVRLNSEAYVTVSSESLELFETNRLDLLVLLTEVWRYESWSLQVHGQSKLSRQRYTRYEQVSSVCVVGELCNRMKKNWNNFQPRTQWKGYEAGANLNARVQPPYQ